MPEDLKPDDITTPGPSDDAGIDMPRNARDVENWLTRMGLTGGATAIEDVESGDSAPFELSHVGNPLNISINDNVAKKPNRYLLYGWSSPLPLAKRNDILRVAATTGYIHCIVSEHHNQQTL